MLFLFFILINFVIVCNLYVAHTMTAEEMKINFIIEQGIIGTICANLFYSLAWGLKGIKAFTK